MADSLNGVLSRIENNALTMSLLQISLVVLAVKSAPLLPVETRQFFELWPVKVAILAFVVFLSNKNMSVAVLVAIVFFVLLQYGSTIENKISELK